MRKTIGGKEMSKKLQQLINEKIAVDYILECRRKYGNNIFFAPNLPQRYLSVPIEFEVPKTNKTK